MRKIIERIQRKVGNPNLLSQLQSLSQSELNTLLLALFSKRAATVSPGQLLDTYATNRFVTPSDIDPIQLRETELSWLKLARQHQFEPIVLSPLAPLGSSSAVAHVDQNNVVSALRGTEVVSDATNVLALQMSREIKDTLNKKTERHYATVHRHTRGQTTDNPKFSPHFSTLCLASSGMDKGNCTFELRELHHHLTLIYDVLGQYFEDDQLSLTLYVKRGGEQLLELIRLKKKVAWSGKQFKVEQHQEHEYYKLLQFKVFIHKDGQIYNIADGGFVDWTQKLLSNKKHRCIISGVGIELLHRI